MLAVSVDWAQLDFDLRVTAMGVYSGHQKPQKNYILDVAFVLSPSSLSPQRAQGRGFDSDKREYAGTPIRPFVFVAATSGGSIPYSRKQKLPPKAKYRGWDPLCGGLKHS